MNNIHQQKIVLVDFIFVFLIVIYAGSATTFVRSTNTWENLIGLLLPIIFSIIMAFKHKIRISKGFAYLLIGFLVYNIALTIKFHEIHPRFMGIYVISFFISYVAISSLRFRFFFYFENILYYLCIIALFFWGIQSIMPDTLKNIFQLISFSEPGSGNVESNIIIYTLPNTEGFESYVLNFGGFSIIRNAGFTWEPGAFACYINLAIFVNLIRTKFKIHKNFRLFIFIIALITTFSTTGFTIFMMLLIFYAYNQHLKHRILFAPVLIALIFYVSTLPFMTEKISDNSEYDTEEMIENSITYDEEFTPQRIQSLQIDFIDFLNNPILGYGGQLEEQWTAKLGANISTISGIGKVLAVFGLVGIFFFFINLKNSSVDFANYFHFEGWAFPFIMIFMISVSYSIIFGPLLMSFWLMNRRYLMSTETPIYKNIRNKI